MTRISNDDKKRGEHSFPSNKKQKLNNSTSSSNNNTPSKSLVKLPSSHFNPFLSISDEEAMEIMQPYRDYREQLGREDNINADSDNDDEKEQEHEMKTKTSSTSDETKKKDDPNASSQLHEIIRILSTHENSNSKNNTTSNTKEINTDISIQWFLEQCKPTTKEEVKTTFHSIQTLLPVLLSMTYLHLWLAKMEASHPTINSKDVDLLYLHQSLKYYPSNAATLSMLANHFRINRMVSLKQLYHLYNLSAENASAIRSGAISILEHEDENKNSNDEKDDEKEEQNNDSNSKDKNGNNDNSDNDAENEVKVWVETLLLDDIAGVEYLGGEMVLIDDDENYKDNDQAELDEMECFGSEDEDEDEKEDRKEKGKVQETNEKKKAFSSNDIKEEIQDTLKELDSIAKGNHNDKEDNNSDDNDEEMVDITNLMKTSASTDDDYSPSEIEATSSFMAALLSSTIGNHTDALKHLRKFYITHRVHPNIWDGAVFGKRGTQHLLQESSDLDEKSDNLFIPQFTPVMISAPKTGNQGVLPVKLYKHLCKIFHPNASYWTESDYDNRGYYSFWLDLKEPKSKNKKTGKKQNDKHPSTKSSSTAKNVIEEVIRYHLLPLIQKTLPEEEANTIIGAEWWTHTRPIQANLGHQLHFDTDEALLELEQKITHPVASSVLYLTTGSDAENSSDDKTGSGSGCTIVFDQNPDSTNVASKAWISKPANNSFMIFPGDLLHGVLPCPGNEKDDGDSNETKKSNDTKDSKEVGSRLTFMVGFWTRRVPDNMPKDREFYGPCGNMPPSTPTHSWVQQIAEGYGDGDGGGDGCHSKIETNNELTVKKLPYISPAWDYIEYDEESDDALPLDLPQGIDHRFFVHGAPRCFRDSLFKDESF